MKKNHSPFDDVWTFAAPDTGSGAVPAREGLNETLFVDEGEPYALAADTVTTVVTSAAKPVASIATLAGYLVNGFWQYNNTIAHHWASNTITYNITGLNSAEQFLALSAMQAWSEVANITFVQTSGSANITFTHNGTMTAYASGSWYGSGAIASMTVNISTDWVTTDGGANDGKTGIDSYAYQTYVHEVGHALGLGHQGPYNGSASYSTNATYANDTWQYSIMSYFGEHNYSGSSYRYVVTPQMADIYAVASMYGAAISTRTGDTVYGFNSNAGAVFNFGNYTSAPALTIYDSGGNDTLDCSSYSAAQTIDLRAGAFSSVGGLVNNIGIALSATIEKAIGGSGNDRLTANDTGCTLSGGGGNDTLIGGAGIDRLIGGSGIDNLTGGSSGDIFVFLLGNSSATSGQHDRIADFVSGTDDIDLSGFDAISSTGSYDQFKFIANAAFHGVAGELNYFYNSSLGVTTLQGDTNGDGVADFAIDLTGNIAINAADLIGVYSLPVTVEATGATTLTQVGSTYYLHANGTTTGPTLKYGGVAYVSGQFGTWTPVGVEATGSGYEVAWKDTSSGRYTVWTTDGNGNYLTNTADFASTSATLASVEAKFQQDFNGDGVIGATATTATIEAFGSTSLVKVGSNYYLNPVAGGSGPSLKFSGTAFVSGQFGTWTPIGAEATGSGYEVAWKDTSSGRYTVWTIDSNGNYLTNTADVAGTSATLASVETRFQQDLNGDGIVGAAAATGATIEAFGSTSLVKVGSNYYLNPVAGGSGPSLKFDGAAFVSGQFGTWTPIGAEAIGSGYEVAWKDTSSSRYTVWTIDSNGNYLTNTADVAGASASLASVETRFQQDLNGDGIVGAATATGATIEAFGSTSLVEVGSNYYLNPVAGGSGPSLKFDGAAFVSGQFGTWTPIGAEAIGSGYEVAWKDTSSGRYTVWTIDSNGNYLTNTADVAGTSATLASVEARFQQDLNGDGAIGATAMTTSAAKPVSAVQAGQGELADVAIDDAFLFRSDLNNWSGEAGGLQPTVSIWSYEAEPQLISKLTSGEAGLLDHAGDHFYPADGVGHFDGGQMSLHFADPMGHFIFR